VPGAPLTSPKAPSQEAKYMTELPSAFAATVGGARMGPRAEPAGGHCQATLAAGCRAVAEGVPEAVGVPVAVDVTEAVGV
jgi:hypothetical protein